MKTEGSEPILYTIEGNNNVNESTQREAHPGLKELVYDNRILHIKKKFTVPCADAESAIKARPKKLSV